MDGLGAASGSMGVMLIGPVYRMPCALAACPTNARNALTMRHLSLAQNSCRITLHNPFTNELSNFMKLHFALHYSGELQVDWLGGRPLAKVKVILESKLYDNLRPRDIHAFVKKEVGVKIPTKARLIQGHANESTAYEHPGEYKAVAKAVKDLGDHEFTIDGVAFRLVYAAGLNHDELSDMFTDVVTPNSYYDERDGKNWDSTMNEQLLRAEISVYEMLNMFAAKGALLRSMKARGSIFFKHYAKIVYETCWKRLSGDWNTSIGNSIISMIICVTVILSLPSHLRPESVVAFFMGDDYLARYRYKGELPCPKELTKALNDLEGRCGITPERGIFNNPLDVTFISLMVWPRHNGGYQFVPKPAKQLAKLFSTHRHVPQRQIQPVLNGITISMGYTYTGFRFMMLFLKSQFSPHSKVKFEAWMRKHLDSTTKEHRDVAWEAGFYHHYGLPIQALPPMRHDVGLYSHPVVDHMLTIESLDPMDRLACL